MEVTTWPYEEEILPSEETLAATIDGVKGLGPGHGTDATRPVTLDVSKFTPATHYPDGFIRGGTPVAKITATGKFGPYTPADSTTGLGDLVGFVYGDFPIDGQANVVAAVLDHGKVREARLPIAVDADGKTDVAGRIQFV